MDDSRVLIFCVSHACSNRERSIGVHRWHCQCTLNQFRRVSADAREVKAVSRALLVRQIRAEVRTALADDIAVVENLNVTVNDLGGAEGRPPVLDRLRLKLLEGSILGSFEQRDTAHGVVEGHRELLLLKGVEKADVGAVEREPWFSVRRVRRVAADARGQSLAVGQREGQGGLVCAAAHVVSEVPLHWPFASVLTIESGFSGLESLR
mmetsp:Transcript_12653/g.24195  ORF Transcript_12653/g.24195 Transcript_12653/m.24195 type:complete len:208 (-) Transcript_12653:101-724(-)